MLEEEKGVEVGNQLALPGIVVDGAENKIDEIDEKEEMTDSFEVEDYDFVDNSDDLDEKHVTPDEDYVVPDIPPHSLDRKKPW